MIKKLLKKKKLVIAIFLAIIVLVAAFLAFKKFYKPEEKKIYEALVSVREMSGAGSAEEKARSTMYPGDVIAIKEGAGNWSTTEQVSYLIVKLNLKPSEAAKLTSPLTEKVSSDEVEAEVKRFKESNPDLKKEDMERFEEEAENRENTLRQREYYIDLKKILPENFDPNSLVGGQPAEDKIFDRKVIEKR